MYAQALSVAGQFAVVLLNRSPATAPITLCLQVGTMGVLGHGAWRRLVPGWGSSTGTGTLTPLARVGPSPTCPRLSLQDLNITGPARVEDIISGQTLGSFRHNFTGGVASHGVRHLVVSSG